MRFQLRLVWLLVLLTLCSTSCTASPTAAVSPIGTFATIAFTIVDDAGSHDLLKDGARLELTLAAGGSVSGALEIPEGPSGTDALMASMAGTWTQHGNVLTFDQPADTFVRDTPFILRSSNRIEADKVFGGSRVLLTLRRQ